MSVATRSLTSSPYIVLFSSFGAFGNVISFGKRGEPDCKVLGSIVTVHRLL